MKREDRCKFEAGLGYHEYKVSLSYVEIYSETLRQKRDVQCHALYLLSVRSVQTTQKLPSKLPKSCCVGQESAVTSSCGADCLLHI